MKMFVVLTVDVQFSADRKALGLKNYLLKSCNFLLDDIFAAL